MQFENMIKALGAIQEEMNRIQQYSPEDYNRYLMCKAIADLAFILRNYMIQKGGPESTSQE
jgi:hypothetical protein